MKNPEQLLQHPRLQHPRHSAVTLEPYANPMQSLLELGLLEAEAMPIFDEATQTAAHFLEMPICTFGLLDRDRIWLKAAVGLSRIGLMNQLAASRQLPRTEELFLQVVERQRPLAVLDAAEDDRFSRSVLVQQYGIRAYLGVPVVDSCGHCLGVMAVMDLAPRQFDDRNVQFLELMARWSISEFERNLLLSQPSYSPVSEFKRTSAPPPSAPILTAVAGDDFSNHSSSHSSSHASSHSSSHASSHSSSHSSNKGENSALIKADLISEMAQELSTPLTSILGMARVLSQGIYGNLTDKQQEYIGIIHNSGQYLLSLVNEIVELGSLDDRSTALNLTPVDVEMLCQLTIGNLNQTAQRREQQIQLSVEPGLRLWMLDKDKVRQMLYHLVFNVIQSSSPDSVIRIHGSRRNSALHIIVWTSHPWLGDGLPMSEHSPSYPAAITHGFSDEAPSAALNGASFALSQSAAETGSRDSSLTQTRSRENLSLMLSHLLAELHQGCITVQGSHEEGFRYVIRLPQLQELAPNN